MGNRFFVPGGKNGRTKPKVVFVWGNFNVVHPGHLRLLRFARECGDTLIVGVTPDKTPGVSVPATLRLESVRAIGMVDRAILIEHSLEECLKALRPDVVVKGSEHADQLNSEHEIIESYGGKLIFCSGEVRFSSFDLLEREYTEPNLSSIRLPRDFPERRGFRISDLSTVLKKLSGMRVTVIGDLIVDEYINCDPLGMSQEDPTIVVTPVEYKRFVGGSGIVAAHAKGLGGDVRFLSVAGVDEVALFAEERLAEYGVSATILRDDKRPTTLKQRYRAAGKTLLRVSHLRQHAIDADLVESMLKQVENALTQTDLLLFSDFNYGVLPQCVVDEVTSMACKKGVPLFADSQASSQVADISRFRGMTLLTPTEREARMALQDVESGLVVISERLRQQAQARHVAITLGAEGMLIQTEAEGGLATDRLPAFNTAPRDVAGAGDSLFASMSMSLTAGADIWHSAYLGSIASACQVARVGNLPLSPSDLLKEIEAPAGYI